MNFIFDNDRPIYVQLVEQLKIKIVSGSISPGERIPSVRDLAMQCQVNPNTMQKALIELEEQELIYTERTNGKFVTKNKIKIEQIKKELAEIKVQTFLQDMKNIGLSKEEAILYLHELGGEK